MSVALHLCSLASLTKRHHQLWWHFISNSCTSHIYTNNIKRTFNRLPLRNSAVWVCLHLLKEIKIWLWATHTQRQRYGLWVQIDGIYWYNCNFSQNNNNNLHHHLRSLAIHASFFICWMDVFYSEKFKLAQSIGRVGCAVFDIPINAVYV